jgi:cytochrome c peroxidase
LLQRASRRGTRLHRGLRLRLRRGHGITFLRAAQAIATFERTITSRSNPFDTFLRGDTNALSDAAVRGLHLFRTEARCANCHHGPALTDGRFHNEGLTYYGRKFQDLGRYEISRRPGRCGPLQNPHPAQRCPHRALHASTGCSSSTGC